MTYFQITSEQLSVILDDAELEADDVVRTGYSGRGMYGGTAGLALAVSENQLRRFLVAAGRVQSAIEHGAQGEEFDATWLADNVETDSLGHGMIAYWRYAEITGAPLVKACPGWGESCGTTITPDRDLCPDCTVGRLDAQSPRVAL